MREGYDFIDVPKDFITKTVIPSGARRDFLEKFQVLLDATITLKCTFMKKLMAQRFDYLVTNEPTRTYFDCPGWTTRATAYEMEVAERAMFHFDYDRDEIMVYYRPTGSNYDGPLTPDYGPNSAHHNVELASE
ncbi:hypothetical protein D1007_20958 [Hordeum vulgare]|nr:hypothetical protein D1007_20958 [Hordeum vulgare]